VDRKKVTKEIGKRQGWVRRNVWCRIDVYLVLLAANCQTAKLARAWCIAGLAIGTCENGGWQMVAASVKRQSGYVRASKLVSVFYNLHPSTTLRTHARWQAAKNLMNSSPYTSQKQGRRTLR